MVEALTYQVGIWVLNGSAVSRGRRVSCLLSAGGAGFGVCCRQGVPGSVSGFSVPRKFVIKKN